MLGQNLLWGEPFWGKMPLFSKRQRNGYFHKFDKNLTFAQYRSHRQGETGLNFRYGVCSLSQQAKVK